MRRLRAVMWGMVAMLVGLVLAGCMQSAGSPLDETARRQLLEAIREPGAFADLQPQNAIVDWTPEGYRACEARSRALLATLEPVATGEVPKRYTAAATFSRVKLYFITSGRKEPRIVVQAGELVAVCRGDVQTVKAFSDWLTTAQLGE